MKNGRMQAKDISEWSLTEFLLAIYPHSAGWWSECEHNIMDAVPAGTPAKVVLAKLDSMIRRGLIEGCACGCRGDFKIRRTQETP